MDRQSYWREKGYTEEQIQNHLSFERYKAKKTRERAKKNNEKNKEIIKQIKNELEKSTFDTGRVIVKIISIRPSVDGVGFWVKMHKTYQDKSEGEFREFWHFEDYKLDEFIKQLSY